MASLAPVHYSDSPGVFIAGLESQDDCESTIQFYSNKNDSWHSVDVGDDPYRYDNQGGFPAFKYFIKDKTHFLLIAGGVDSNG